METSNLLSLFSGRIFRVPDYQRGYAWERKQLEELWDDIDEIQRGENETFNTHYTGAIFLEKTCASENEEWLAGVNFYNVVDGQQRLTTICILIHELLQLGINGYCGESQEDLIKTYLYKRNVSGNSTVYKFSYSDSDDNYSFLINQIYEDQSGVLQEERNNLYTRNLYYAKEFFRNNLQNISYTGLEEIFKKLTNALQFDVRLIEKDLDVQAVFETMNNRGKSLSTLEKLKNRLIYLSQKLKDVPEEDKKALRASINNAWGEIYTNLGKNPDNILDEDEFLSAHLSLYRKPKEAVFSEKNAEIKVFQMFCNKAFLFFKNEGQNSRDENNESEEIVSFDKINEYVISLSNSAALWYKIHNLNEKVLKQLLLLNGAKEIKVFLLALFLKTGDINELNPILLSLEKILFRNRIPGIGIMDERIVATYARNLFSEEDDLGSILDKLEEYIKLDCSNENLIRSMNNLFSYQRGAKGFYRWRGLKYFLFKYEDNLKQRFKEFEDKITLDQFHVTTIEHIIPSNYTPNWSEVVADFINGIDEEKQELAKKALLNTLGNLTILRYSKNYSLKDKGWEEKKKRFSTGSYNEIAVSKNDSWTKEQVTARGLDMLDFLIKEVHGLSLTLEDKYRLLFYQNDFIERIMD